MWFISYGFGDDARALPQTSSVRFSYATELFAHLDALRRGRLDAIPLEGQPAFSLASLRAVAVGHRAEEEPEGAAAPELHLRAQIGNANPLDLIEAFVHAIGRRVQPGAPWANDPPPSPDARRPETWPLPEGRLGRWMIEWPAEEQSPAWAHGGMAWGDGVRPQADWVEGCLTPLFSPPTLGFKGWFEREIVARRPEVLGKRNA